MGLRETKKLQTREAIAAAGMRLFVTRGFDHVTVGEIAREAGVSEKTVFNYFPTKEDIFFDEVPERLEALAEAVCECPAPKPLLSAMHGLPSAQSKRLTSPRFPHFARVFQESPARHAKEAEGSAPFPGRRVAKH